MPPRFILLPVGDGFDGYVGNVGVAVSRRARRPSPGISRLPESYAASILSASSRLASMARLAMASTAAMRSGVGASLGAGGA